MSAPDLPAGAGDDPAFAPPRHRSYRLHDVLADVAAADPAGLVDADEIADLRAELERVVAELAVELPDEARPLRAPKDRLTRVLACERNTLATLGPAEPAAPLVLGAALDHLVAHHLLGGDLDDPVAVAREALAVSGATAALDWWDRSGDDAASIERRLVVAAGCLRDGWGEVERGWWPRTQVDTSVVLADGAVICSARFDVVLGGPPTGRPSVVVEVKSGRARPAHRDDLLWYALLLAARDGVAPALVTTWSAADDAVVPQPVTAGALEAAARRGVAGITLLVELAAGRPPTERAGPQCGWCPELDRCATGRAELARRAAGDDPERWSDDVDDSRVDLVGATDGDAEGLG